ncbi:hypothetical protein SPBR_03812 [Sporothrix brasiliensis 5110]|uniref:Quinone oxidoreductase n=1 Tax=Sporothrix brasiliensis 5110 TaxID=1398154 RepID=A0A0C2J0F7_9PEZI|nr:uncharacterized protein SPBR_03812 [Sporothrix brasiliensis 5110]KIH94861.1 hypothetical protein SPBR_03812 [Sporothrix brasiliensis 5110]
MHYAQVQAFGQPPQYLEGPDLPAPTGNQIRLKVLAAAVHRLVQMRAKGAHFSATSAPLDPSSDGVAVDEATGQVYYVGTFAAPLFAEYANVDKARLVPLPAGADPVTVAALANPVQSSWMSLAARVNRDVLPEAFSVLILGVTGTSGRAAVDVARQFGAGTVVGAGRREAPLQALVADKALDAYLVLDDATLAAATRALGHVDVVLDYVWGAQAATVLNNLQPGAAVTQYVNIGTTAQEETLALSAQTLRAKNLTLSGAAPGSYTLAAAGKELPAIVAMAASLPKPADVVPYPLSEVARVWDTDEARKKRLVLLPGTS